MKKLDQKCLETQLTELYELRADINTSIKETIAQISELGQSGKQFVEELYSPNLNPSILNPYNTLRYTRALMDGVRLPRRKRNIY